MVNGQDLESATGEYYRGVSAGVTQLSCVVTACLIANDVLCFLASGTVSLPLSED